MNSGADDRPPPFGSAQDTRGAWQRNGDVEGSRLLSRRVKRLLFSPGLRDWLIGVPAAGIACAFSLYGASETEPFCWWLLIRNAYCVFICICIFTHLHCLCVSLSLFHALHSPHSYRANLVNVRPSSQHVHVVSIETRARVSRTPAFSCAC